jgi:hypothetical protein
MRTMEAPELEEPVRIAGGDVMLKWISLLLR